MIENKLLENLAMIRELLLAAEACTPLSPSTYREAGKRGRCYYDRCPDKTLPSNERISIREGKEYRRFTFHTSCLDKLVADNRFSKQ